MVAVLSVSGVPPTIQDWQSLWHTGLYKFTVEKSDG